MYCFCLLMILSTFFQALSLPGIIFDISEVLVDVCRQSS